MMELKRHPSLIFADEFNSLCQPIFNLGIDYFSHLRAKGNCITGNGSNPDYFRFYFENEFQHSDIQVADFSVPQRYILWDHIEKRGTGLELYKIEREFGIDHIFTIVEQVQDEKNYYCFGAHPSKTHMNEFYFRHVELLERFVLYFKNALLLNNRLNRAYTMTCTFKADSDIYLINNDSSLLSSQTISDYLTSINQTHTFTQVSNISRRELQCAICLLEGNTSIEIAKLLNISPRTVEVYLMRLKKRFGSKNKIHLVRSLVESGLLSGKFGSDGQA